jgi:hypothetical protein
MQQDSVAVQPGLADVGWERELTGGAHASVRGEREDIEDGMEGMNQRRKCILWNTPKVRAGQAGQRREQRPAEEAGRCGEGGRGRPVGLGGPKGKWSRWLLGRLGRKLKKSFQNKN